MEAEAIRDESDAQKSYEEFVKDTNRSTEEKSRQIVSTQGVKATAEGDLAAAKQDHADTMIHLEQLGNSKADLHKACDFTMKNFDIRQEAFDQEVEALRQAKAILSGADFMKAFMQKSF
jgi:hypothetical protein